MTLEVTLGWPSVPVSAQDIGSVSILNSWKVSVVGEEIVSRTSHLLMFLSWEYNVQCRLWANFGYQFLLRRKTWEHSLHREKDLYIAIF